MCTPIPASLAGLRHGAVGEILANFGIGDVVIEEITVEVAIIRAHIYQAMSGEVEEDNFFLAGLSTFLGFADGGGDGM